MEFCSAGMYKLLLLLCEKQSCQISSKKEKNTFYFASQLNTDFVFKVTLRRHHQKTAAAAAALLKKKGVK